MDENDSEEGKIVLRKSTRGPSTSQKNYQEFEANSDDEKLAIFDDSGSDFENDLRQLKNKFSLSESSEEELEKYDTPAKKGPKRKNNDSFKLAEFARNPAFGKKIRFDLSEEEEAFIYDNDEPS